MRKQNLFLLINTAILLVIGAAFVWTYDAAVPKDLDDQLFGQVVTLGEAEIVTNIPTIGQYSIVHTVQDAFNSRGDKIGVVYNVRATYTYFLETDPGYVELLVAVDLDQNVTVQIVDLKQTSTYTAGLQNYVYEYFQGFGFDQLILIPIVNLEDPEAGATASASTGKIKELVGKAIEYHATQQAELSEVNVG
jgi:hypothetical protein